MTQMLDVARVKAMLKDGTVFAFLDVREEGEFSTQGHPLFATPLPLSRLEPRALALLPDPATRIVLMDSGEDAVDPRGTGRAERAAAAERPRGDVAEVLVVGGVGRLVGATVAALEAAAGVRAVVVGKPAPHLITTAMHRVGATAATTVMIGDSPSTDIAAANAAGVRSILLLTGVTSADDIALLPASERPTFVARDAAALDALLRDLD